MKPYFLIPLILTGCGDTFHPPPLVTPTRALQPGDRLECTETFVKIGVPFLDTPIVVYVNHTIKCTLT